MRLLDREPVTESFAGDAASFRLGVVAGDQLMELPHGKTTIGSSPRCNVPIQEPGVQPLHCLILRDGDELTVRRWAGEAWLNGVAFDTAPLFAGDCLAFGSVELKFLDLDADEPADVEELEDTQELSSVRDEESGLQQDEQPATPCSEPNGVLHESSIDQGDASLGLAADSSNLAIDLQTLREQIDQVEQNLAGWDEDRTQWLEVRQGLDSQRQEWQEQRAQWAQQLGECDGRIVDCAARIDKLQQLLSDLRVGSVELPPSVSQPVELTQFPDEPQHDDSLPKSADDFDWSAISDRIAKAKAQSEENGIEGEPSGLSRRDKPAGSLGFEATSSHTGEGNDADGAGPYSEFSVWNREPQQAASQEPAETFGGQNAAESGDANEHSVSKEVAQSAPSSTSQSFIEQYAHLLADDSPADDETTNVPQPPAMNAAAAEKPLNVGVVRPAESARPTADGDEESVEQYMAKLLQRVRGDGPTVSASQGPPKEAASSAESMDERPAMAEAPLTRPEPVFASDAETQWMANFNANKRKQTAPAPATDLEALRALANETARRAISTHSLRKYRRIALTKVIVASLAGMTSLLLMLESPDWRNLQFITACVALLVAAYWAGQAYRTFLQSRHVPTYDENGDELDGMLPIDV